MSGVVIVGAGEHGRLCREYLQRTYPDRFRGFLDDRPSPGLLGATSEIPVLARDGCAFFVAVGEGRIRERLFAEIRRAGGAFVSVIHVQAIVSASARLGEGVFIGPGAIVNTGAAVEEGAYVNSGAIVEHDARLGAFSHLAPGAVLGGGAQVGCRCFIGLRAAVRDHVEIVDDVLVGMQAAVTSDVRTVGTYLGIPARLRRH